MLRHFDSQAVTDVSKERSAFMFRIIKTKKNLEMKQLRLFETSDSITSRRGIISQKIWSCVTPSW